MSSFVDDTLKDNNKAWDMVRIGAGFAAWSGTVVILVHMVKDDHFADHLAVYVGGLIGLWTGYAAAVWGHSYAKT